MGIFKRRGCLVGKTPQQVDDFFESLYKMRSIDMRFFHEQYWDLRKWERNLYRRYHEKRYTEELSAAWKDLIHVGLYATHRGEIKEYKAYTASREECYRQMEKLDGLKRVIAIYSTLDKDTIRDYLNKEARKNRK